MPSSPSNHEPDAAPNQAGDRRSTAASPPAAAQPISPAPTSPAPVQEKHHHHSYYGPQPPHSQQPQPQPGGYFVPYPQGHGQNFQPYFAQQGVPPPPPDFRGPARMPPPEEAKNWRITLISLHAASFVFALADIALSLSLLKWGVYSSAYYGDLPLVALYTIVAPALALLWSGSELAVRSMRSSRRGITPGAHVGVCLIVWLAAIVCGGMTAGYASWLVSIDGSHRRSSYCNDYPSWYGDCDERDEEDMHTRSAIFVSTVVFKFLVWAVNFTLFVRACIDTHRRNAASRPVVYIPYWAGPAAQGWQTLQNHDGQPAQGGQDIPMQARTPGSHASPAPAAEVTSPAPSHQTPVQEYYTPGPPGTAR